MSPRAALLCMLLAPALAHAADHPGPDILTDDVTRFYALYDATGGKPGVERIEKDYLGKGTPSLGEFAKLRRVTAQSIADRLASNPEIYANAKQCMAELPAAKARLATALDKLVALYPQAKLPPVAIVVGRGKPVGMAYPGGLTIGLEALCAADFMNPDLQDRFVHVIAHEYAHIQQTMQTDFEAGDPDATVLRMSLAEGAAELIAEVISGNVANPGLTRWTAGREAEVEAAFVREMDGTDLSNWLYNYRAGSDAPYDLGYWVGYRITKAYYVRSTDRREALKQIIEMDDPAAFLAKSGWTPGMALPASAND